jgi:hypothetical protein
MERNNAKFLDSLRSRTRKLTHLISHVQKETEVEMTTDNQTIEKNVELINIGATEIVAERQELLSEVVNVDSVRSLDDRCWYQQMDVRRCRNLKGNGVPSKELIAGHTRVIRRAVPALRKGKIRK